jgi:hypothetical protein
MRNLKEYPITRSEIETILRLQAERLQGLDGTVRFGDIRPAALRLAAKFINQHQVEFAKFMDTEE